MKKLPLLTAILLLLTGFAYAQQTYVPDDNFEHYLETHDTNGNTVSIGSSNSMGNGIDNDNYVTTSKINTVTHLDMSSNVYMFDATGIEDFTAIQVLNLDHNHLSSIDLSHNTALQEVSFCCNNLTSLDVSQNTALQILNCESNQLTSLDVSQNTLLQILDCSYNHSLSSLDISHNTALLELDCSQNLLSILDVSQNTSLQKLTCFFNRLISLDVTHNTALLELNCHDNEQITSLNISQNTALQKLICWNNYLTSLDVSHNTALQVLRCSYNQLRSLDVSQNTALTVLYCSNNQPLTNIYMRNGNNNRLTSFGANYNPNLTCIEVDDPAYMPSHFHYAIDATASYSTSCPMGETYVPDDNFENYLETHDVTGNTVPLGDANSMGNGIANDNYVTSANIYTVTNLNIVSQNISDLTGIEDFTALQVLDCSNNQLTELDISYNPVIQSLDCSNNQLTDLYMRNGNNTNFTGFDAINNQNLTCVSVDNPDYMTTHWPNAIDATAAYTLHCPLGETYVPDNKFEHYLETHDANGNRVSAGDPNSMGNGIEYDDYVTTSKINTVTNLNIGNRQISDITGIEDFTALQILNIGHNNLSNIDLSHNTALQELYCARIYSVDVTQNTALRVLDCHECHLHNLDVTQNIALEELNCSRNYLSNIDLSHNIALQNLDCSYNEFTNLDLSQNTNLQILDFSYCSNFTGTNYVSNINLSQNTALIELHCDGNKLTSLDLSHNTALEEMSFYSNDRVTSLDLSHNIALQTLICSSNDQLTTLILRSPDLQILHCNYNQQLTNLDVSQNTALQELECHYNQLTNLDLSHNTALQSLDCIYNNLTEINLHNGNNHNLTHLSFWGNSNLSCIEVDDPVYMNNHWPYSHYGVHCPLDEAYVPDDNFEYYLETHDTNGNTVIVGASNSLGNGIADDNYASKPRMNTVVNLNIASLNIADLTGIENFTNLQVLDCHDNQATGLDISQNTDLQTLDCKNNQISDLDISHNTFLHNLDCKNNQISGLDATQNTVLQTLDCSDNQLTELNIRNGNNTNLSAFNAINNPNLICVEVDDATYMNAHWVNAIEPTATYTTHCPLGETYVPDDNFEHYLETHDANGNHVSVGNSNSLGNGIDNDDSVTTSKINTVTALYVSYKNITDLSGIEDFTALQVLYCSNNQITNLDLTQNIALQELYCSHNQLASLNITGCSTLQTLHCNSNQLTSLDFIGCTALQILECNYNPLTSIDLSHNTVLQELYCSNTQLTNLNLSHNTALKKLYFSYNDQMTSLDFTHNTALQELWCTNNDQLTSLNLTHNTALQKLWCNDNQINSLDLTHNFALRRLNAFRNQLSYLDVRNGHNYIILTFEVWGNPDLICIFVDDANHMDFNFNVPAIDTTQHYVETQAQCDALAIDSQFMEEVINIYPIPTKEVLNVQSEIDAQYQIYDYAGKKLLQGRIVVGENHIPVQEFAKGLYLIRIDSEGNSLLKKIIIGN